MSKLRSLLETRRRLSAEARQIVDNPAGTDGDLSPEQQSKFDALKAEIDTLETRIERQEYLDELDRRSEGTEVSGTGDGTAVERRASDGWALTREQRQVDYVARTSGQSAAEIANLSVGRIVRAALIGNWRGAEAEQRVMGTTVNTTGGFFIPDAVSANVIDRTRNVSVLGQAGVLTIPIEGNNITMPRVLTDPTAQWRGEGVEITESDGAFDAILVTPGSIAALVRVNAELLDDAPAFASTLDAMLAAALALKLDHAGLYGSGVGAEPTGLRNATGVNEISMGTNGATPADYDDFLDLIRDVELDNGTPDTLIWSPRTKNTLAQIKTGITSDLTKLAPPADFAALKKLVSNQVSITETQGSSNAASTAFIGGFQNMAIAMRQSIQIEASRTAGTAFAKNQVLVRAIMRASIAILRPSQFGRLVGITA